MAIRMDIFKMLQFFAEGGEGGDSGTAASTGENPAAAGQARFRELGVPESKIRKDRAYKLPPAKAAAQPQQAAAAEPKEAPKTEAEPPKKLSFDELLASDEEYKTEFEKRSKETASGVRRKLAEASDRNKAAAPIIEMMARKYGMDMETLDLGELAKAVENDRSFYEDAAFARGVPVEEYMSNDIRARAAAREQRAQEESIKQQTEREWVERVHRESLNMKDKYPGFDLQEEMKNPRFAAMLNPYLNFSVEDAYYHVHRKEIEAARDEAITKRVMEQVSANIRAGQARPTEAGAGSQARAASPVPAAAAYDPKRSAAIKDAVTRAKARGEKIYPGQI